MRRAVGGPTCRGCADGFICGGGGVANTTEGGCPGGKEDCGRRQKVSRVEQETEGKVREESMEMQVIIVFFLLIISNK